MNEFKTILTKLKEIIKHQLQTDKKVLDKDVAETLGINSTTLASCKRRGKVPYKVILDFCVHNQVSAADLLFNESTGDNDVKRVTIKYFRNMSVYSSYFEQLKQ